LVVGRPQGCVSRDLSGVTRDRAGRVRQRLRSAVEVSGFGASVADEGAVVGDDAVGVASGFDAEGVGAEAGGHRVDCVVAAAGPADPGPLIPALPLPGKLVAGVAGVHLPDVQIRLGSAHCLAGRRSRGSQRCLRALRVG